MDKDPGEERCSYTIRVKREDGTEQVIRKECPFIEACREQGKSCVLPPAWPAGQG
ncbi:MAG TPA: hypothetical protein VN436_05395 [Holophaga sp.]|nr:hypothetical protein [Holophaga sp.]